MPEARDLGAPVSLSWGRLCPECLPVRGAELALPGGRELGGRKRTGPLAWVLKASAFTAGIRGHRRTAARPPAAALVGLTP